MKKISETNINILDGDRGKNYPSPNELYKNGFCLFLSNKNIVGNRLNLEDCAYITEERHNLLRQGTLTYNDIVLTTRGTVGNLLFVDSTFPLPSRINSGMVILRSDQSEYLQKYLFYYLQSSYVREQIDELQTGSAQPQLPIKDINQLKIESISIAKQQHIVDILGSIDNSIENNEKIAANLETYAISKYQEITKGISDFITLGEIVDIYDSKRKPLSSRERESRKGNYRYYGATGVLDYVNDYLFDGEYVLLAEDGTVIDENGYPIVQLVTGQFWVNNHAHIMQAKAGYTNYSLYVALKKLSVNTAVTGAVQLKINQANLCALEMPRIDENKLLTFNQEIEPLFLKIIHIRAEIEKLKELKQLYLHKFFG